MSNAINGYHHDGDEIPQDTRSISPVPSATDTHKSSRASSRLTGTVKWFNAKQGYGFITRADTGEDVFIHFTGISKKNPLHAMKSLGDGEAVEFNIMVTNCTGPHGAPVRGNPYVSHIPMRRNDGMAAGDPATFNRSPPRRRFRSIVRFPNWNYSNPRG